MPVLALSTTQLAVGIHPGWIFGAFTKFCPCRTIFIRIYTRRWCRTCQKVSTDFIFDELATWLSDRHTDKQTKKRTDKQTWTPSEWLNCIPQYVPNVKKKKQTKKKTIVYAMFAFKLMRVPKLKKKYGQRFPFTLSPTVLYCNLEKR